MVRQSASKDRTRGDVVTSGAGVFVLTKANKLVPLQTASFAIENDFQALLAEFLALLAGDQIRFRQPAKIPSERP
jgi:hypothetical protein